jgi:NTE family protein
MDTRNVRHTFRFLIPGRRERLFRFCAALISTALLVAGCTRYPENEPLKQVDRQHGYRAKFMGPPGNAENILFYLTLSGGGTRAAALSYGVFEELRRTEVVIDGRKRRLLDEIDRISSVSGGSFTAGYYGLFGDRIFEDFESKFLKKDIQKALALRTFLNPVNWVRLLSRTFDRSDLAAEYYDEHIFKGGTFGDITARKGPMIQMNATDMTHGLRIGFNQETFDMICSDLSVFPVARAVAASSAVPILLSPITIRNYAGTCGYKPSDRAEQALRDRELSERQLFLKDNILPLLDSQKKPFIHLVDGGVADNLGLRAVLERVIDMGSFWELIKGTPREDVNKIVLIVVNAATQPDTKWDGSESMPPVSAMLSAYPATAIERYNEETIALLKENVKPWEDEIRAERCKGGTIFTAPGSCGDIQFYVIEVKFDALKDEAERMHFKRLPTALKLPPEEVDKLRDVARRLLAESEEFQRLLRDLRS